MRIIRRATPIFAAQLSALAVLPVSVAVDTGSATGSAGTWSRAQAAPGVAAFYDGTEHWTITPTSISCASPGNCAVVGYYENTLKQAPRPFLLSQVKGVWARARTVPSLAALAPHGAAPGAVSCATAGRSSSAR
jgi:hypothetical protein